MQRAFLVPLALSLTMGCARGRDTNVPPTETTTTGAPAPEPAPASMQATPSMQQTPSWSAPSPGTTTAPPAGDAGLQTPSPLDDTMMHDGGAGQMMR